MRVSWAFECSPDYGLGGDRTPEKRKVGGSTPPLTTTRSSRFSGAYFHDLGLTFRRVCCGCSRCRCCARLVSAWWLPACPGWFPGVLPLSVCGVRVLPGCSWRVLSGACGVPSG